MRVLRRALILTHRYLGIGLSLLFVVWFLSGITMMYAGGMPRLTPELRLQRLPALDLAHIHLTPTDAATKAGMKRNPARVSLLSVMDRPAYRFGGPTPVTIFADTGDQLDEVGPDQAMEIATRFMDLPSSQLHYVRTLTQPDQWTIGQARQMPLYKFSVDDPDRTELYVSADLGEVTTLTTRPRRALAWIGTIPHWLYFAQLRSNQPLWSRIVIWTSGLGCVLAVLGLVLGVTQFRRKSPASLANISQSIPYSGWMRWHYITGVVFGVFTLTWVFSGLLSMEPFGVGTGAGLEVGRNAFTGGSLDLAAFPVMDPTAWDRLVDGHAIKEVEFLRIQGDPYYLVRREQGQLPGIGKGERLHQPYQVTGRTTGTRLLVRADTLEIHSAPFSVDSLMDRLKQALPEAPIAETTLLADYDSYYYSRGRETPLPILRVKFADPDKTWFYIDPEMSQVVARIHRVDRVERWLYNGLHSLDFSFWYNRRPLWDIGMIVLLLGGTASSGIGLYIGARRVLRPLVRTVKLALRNRSPDVSPRLKSRELT